MLERVRRQQPSARRALHEALLNQIGFDDLLDRVARLGKRGGDGLDADRAAAKTERDGVEITPVHLIEADGVDVEQFERPIGDFAGDEGCRFDDGEVSDTAQQAAGDARRAARAARDLVGAFVPSLLRFLILVGGVVAVVYGAMYALATNVKVQPREMTEIVEIPKAATK